MGVHNGVQTKHRFEGWKLEIRMEAESIMKLQFKQNIEG